MNEGIVQMEHLIDFSPEHFWWKIVITFIMWVLTTVVMGFLTRNHKKWMSRRWVLTTGWFFFMVFILFLDGPLLGLGVTHIVFYCAASMSIIFILADTIEKTAEIKIKKGDLEIEATMKENGAKLKGKNND